MGTGGAAGTKGYLFQQRVCAAFLMIEILEKPLSLVLGEKFDFRPKSFFFEGDTEIDDLHFEAEDWSMFANIKTNLRLSASKDGALSSAFGQFARQHKSKAGQEHFLLICDDKSSNQVVMLGELLDRVRLVGLSSVSSLLLDDQDRRLFDQILALAKESLRSESAEAAFQLLQKISIVIFSFDFSASFVQALKVLAASSGFARPEQLWDKLTLDCFSFAKARQVIDSGFLRRRYEVFREEKTKSDFNFFSELTFEKEEIDWVKELVVAEFTSTSNLPKEFHADASDDEGSDDSLRKVAVLEMYRFDEHGKRRFDFRNGMVHLQSGLQLKVLGRCASFAGFERLIDMGRIDLKDASIRIFPANVDWVEKKNELHALAHASAALLAFEDRIPKDVCLECGRPLFASRVQLVEIDEASRAYQCGPVHLDCLSPTARVIGDVQMPAAEQYKALRSFDINRWAELVKNGPAGYGLLNPIPEGAVLFWNWTNVIRPKGNYSAKMIGEDQAGSREEQYVTERGKIVLRGKDDQIANVNRMKEIVGLAKAEGDPLVFEVGGVFGPKSGLKEMDRDFGPVYEIVDFVVEKYSREKMAALSGKFQWYSPVCVLRSGSGKLFEYRESILLVRDPFKFPRLVGQLEGLVAHDLLKEIWLDIIESDHEFDSIINACFSLGLNVMLDPSLDARGEFRRGAQVQPMPYGEDERESLIDRASALPGRSD